MQHVTMAFGLARALLGGDGRSRSQRQRLRRLGRTFLKENFGTASTRSHCSPDSGLEDHPNALPR